MTTRTILLIDDDPLSLERLGGHLTAEGYRVVTAEDCLTGIALAKSEHPDLVITDLLLPRMNGFQLTKALKQDPALANVPVLWMTAFYGRDDIHRTLGTSESTLSERPVLFKPFQRQELLNQVQALLSPSDAPSHGAHILVVDDDPANLELIERRLEVEDFTSELLETGGAALDRVRTREFDAVLLDLRLPDIEGLEVLASLRASHPHLPVIIMTAHGSESLAVKALKEGASDYLIKPIGRRDLVNSLRNALEKNRLQAENRRVQRNLFDAMLALNVSNEELEHAHQRLRGLLNCMEDGVLILDAKGQVEFLNPAGIRLMRCSAPLADLGALGARVAEVRDDQGALVDLTGQIMCRLRTPHAAEYVVRWKDGQEQAFWVSANPYCNQAGDETGRIILFRDTTARWQRKRKLEALLKEPTQELEAVAELQEKELARAAATAERMKNEILAAVSHELRTPLNFIVGFGSLLAEGVEGDLSPRQREVLDKMLMGADRLTRTVDDLLDYAMLTSGMLQPNQEPVPLADLARDVLEEFSPEARERQISMQVEVQTEQQPLGDIGYTRKILRQLTSNALKFTRSGGQVWLRIRADGPCLLLEVQDTGIGIDAEIRPHIFDRFYQGESHSTRRFGGTGMGLALVKGLADEMGLQLEVDSVVNEGSTFRVIWPSTESPASRP